MNVDDVVDSYLQIDRHGRRPPQEKAAITKRAKVELAQTQKRGDHHKELREKAGSFVCGSRQVHPGSRTAPKYTNEILKRFGRAYDYRLTTLSDSKFGDLEAS